MKLPFNTSSISKSIGLGVICALSSSTFLNAQVTDPGHVDAPFGDLVLPLVEFSRVPQSSGGGQGWARINHLKPDSFGRLFVNDLRGPLHIVSEGESSLYLDLSTEFNGVFFDSSGLGSGFTSFAFHPEFATNGKFYTSHSESPNTDADFPLADDSVSFTLQGVITEWTATDPTSNVFAGSSREVMRVNLRGTIHGMQEISFNTGAGASSDDYGNLYICIGDAQTTIHGFPELTHRLDSVLGSILRIDPLGSNSANGQYGIPAGNPWADDGDDNTLSEIFAYGFRNPHRISWDVNDETFMLSGDIGQRSIEEINLIEAGNDYGWNVREGTFVINAEWVNNPSAGEDDEVFELPANDADLGFTYPVAQLGRNEARAIIGGYVYRGSSFPTFEGKYIFGDLADGGKIFYIDTDSVMQNAQSSVTQMRIEFENELYDTVSQFTDDGVDGRDSDLRFGYDGDNELYVLSKFNGKIYKVEEEEPQDPKLVNISTRGNVKTGDDVLIGGFVIAGEEEKTVLIQGVGVELVAVDRSLGGLVLVDPVVSLYDSGQNLLATNDDWHSEDSELKASVMESVGATELLEQYDSAGLLATLPAGAYTVIVSGKDESTGIALVEVYEVDDELLP